MRRLSNRRAALWMVALSAVTFAAMAFATKVATRTLPAGEVTFFRFLVMLIPFAFSPRLARQALTWQRTDLLIYRGLFGGVAVLLYFLAIEHIPVGTATLLNYSSPLWSVLFAGIFLGERSQPIVLVPFGVAVLGMLLVTGALDGGTLDHLGVWELAGFASSILSGAAVAAIRAARRTEGSWAIYGSFTIFGLLVAAPFSWIGAHWPQGREWIYLLSIGALSILAQLLLTYAYRWVTNVQAGVFAQLTVVVSMAFGVLFLDEPLGGTRILGATLALAGIVGVVALHRPPRAVE
jgi:drug/metabolite transporter (DMT)-like permease